MLNFILGIKRFVRNVIMKDKNHTIKSMEKEDMDMDGIKKELGFVYVCSDGRKFACKKEAIKWEEWKDFGLMQDELDLK